MLACLLTYLLACLLTYMLAYQVRMEELGGRGRVHISDSAAEVLGDIFPLEV